MSVSTQNITVEVSGSRFCIIPSLFKHIEKLNWKKQRVDYQGNTTLKLNANPDVFESVLQFFLYGKLPDPKSLTGCRAKVTIDFVSPLDPIAVKPLVAYLQPFVIEAVIEESSNAKDLFKRRKFTHLSSSFSSRDHRFKHKISDRSTIDDKEVEVINRTGNKSRKGNNHCDNKYNYFASSRNVLSTVVSSIPTHIKYSEKTSTTIAEVSVCSFDESVASKLSLPSSSSSLGMMMGAAAQDEDFTSTSLTSTNHHVRHSQKRCLYQHQHRQDVSTLGRGNYSLNQDQWTQESMFYVDSRKPKPAETVGHQAHVPTKLKSPDAIPEEYYQQRRVVKDKSYAPRCNNILDDQPETSKMNLSDVQNNSSKRHKFHTTTKMISTFLGDSKKRWINNDNAASRTRNYVTHADWCNSEYIV